ncbi:MAG: acyltransferase family protein [Candidatus Nanopelagicaceae bacterium]|jgi:peptidoglycan/LPS O-acetylase OafA/YrhL
MTAPKGIRYIPAIDGLRALAVIAVLLYHLGFSWIPGGFLGVDLFFVISGYVITRLLLDSIQRSGGLDLRGFYAGRIRRLLPPLLFMLVITAIFVGVWAPDSMRRFLTDAPFALTGLMNWWLVFKEQDYFESFGRPPLLQHTWSLGVEAQYYLVWPLILLFVLKVFGKKVIPTAALAIATFSGIALFLASVRADISATQDISHVYFGTDTHSIGLFLGSALAVSWIPQNLRMNIEKRAQDFIDFIGVFGLIGILASFLFIQEADPTAYRIAFPLVGIFGSAIIMSVVHPASRFAPLLQHPFLVWIGERSYAIYLWHWIVFQVTRPAQDLTGSTWALYLFRILVVFALADISQRWIEVPVRNGAISNWLRGMKYRTKEVQRRQKATAGLTVLALIATITVVSNNAITIADRNNAVVKQMFKDDQVATISKIDGLWVVGDSVILGIRNELESKEHIGLINARVGRQAGELLEVIKKDKAKMQGMKTVINLGNNNRLVDTEVAEIFFELKDQPLVVVVNTAVPRTWRDENNQLIQREAMNYANIKIVDWALKSENHPEYFAPDGVHLIPAGISAYVAEIVNYLY